MTRAALAPALASFALPALAEGPAAIDPAPARVDAGRAAVEAFAARLDADGDRAIDRGELAAGAALAFPSIDKDGSGTVDAREWRDWEFGLGEMAAFRGRAQAYDAAMGIVFDLLDRDGDGALTAVEYRESMAAAHASADRNGDGRLGLGAFYQGFLVNVALRHAMVAD